jgi:hypothetical protein
MQEDKIVLLLFIILSFLIGALFGIRLIKIKRRNLNK